MLQYYCIISSKLNYSGFDFNNAFFARANSSSLIIPESFSLLSARMSSINVFLDPDAGGLSIADSRSGLMESTLRKQRQQQTQAKQEETVCQHLGMAPLQQQQLLKHVQEHHRHSCCPIAEKYFLHGVRQGHNTVATEADSTIPNTSSVSRGAIATPSIRIGIQTTNNGSHEPRPCHMKYELTKNTIDTTNGPTSDSITRFSCSPGEACLVGGLTVCPLILSTSTFTASVLKFEGTILFILRFVSVNLGRKRRRWVHSVSAGA